MKLNYIKASPSQNMTAFITSDVPPADYARVASVVMDYEYLHVEQVGFIVESKHKETILRLEMSGGEFCGNALLSAGAYCLYKDLSDSDVVLLETSGSDKVLECHVIKRNENLFVSKAEMPQAIGEKDITIVVEGQSISGKLVQLEGITHFITHYWPAKTEYPLILEALLDEVVDKAIGIIPYRKKEEGKYDIVPFVYVTDTGTQVFERACGSGTLALGITLADGEKGLQFQVYQPGGMINVEIGDKNYISTEVQFTSEGIVNMAL